MAAEEDLRALSPAEAEKRLTTFQEAVKTLEKQLAEAAPPEQIKQWIIDLCNANDIKMDREGNTYEVPNWAARDRGLERVFQILKVQQSKEGNPQGNMPTKISINVINQPAPAAPIIQAHD